MPAQLVAHVLYWLLTATALVLLAVLWGSRAALLPAAHALAGRIFRAGCRWGPPVLVLAVGVIAVDAWLPPELTPSRIERPRTLPSGRIEVSFATCCTGGGTATCDVPHAPWVRESQAIEVRRSSLLGRCTVEPRPVEGACRCS